MGRLSPNNHGAIPLIFTFSPFHPFLFSSLPLSSPLFYLHVHSLRLFIPPTNIAMILPLVTWLVHVSSARDVSWFTFNRKTAKCWRVEDSKYAQGSGERKSPSGVQGQRRGRVWGQSTSLEKAPENRCTLHTQSHSITRFWLHTEQLRYNALCSASFIWTTEGQLKICHRLDIHPHITVIYFLSSSDVRDIMYSQNMISRL